MNIKMSAISASVLLMLAGGAMAEDPAPAAPSNDEYIISYNGEVVTDSCILTGNGNGLTVNMEPVMDSMLQDLDKIANGRWDNNFAMIVCEGGKKNVSIAWGTGIETITSAATNQSAIVPDHGGDSAEGAYILTLMNAVDEDGKAAIRYPDNTTPLKVGLDSKDDGTSAGKIKLYSGYVTAKKGDKFDTVVAGSVTAAAPVVISYE
ncbi:hypothetical protein ACQ2HG_16505 [Aeromonas hydrophila]|uniref:hypothetical protein n=1 Tax=Aeromonas hydrophila TaxID=644 RepID=UPI001F53A7CE|nr:hypothetical protein [Aeromonas hydrophila]UUT59981.1 hypothetical protein MOO40_00295 [Aeromonas hydrophila]